ncbi:hypothetical protein JCM16303_003564 [Sporobolomyces ruberrimus]
MLFIQAFALSLLGSALAIPTYLSELDLNDHALSFHAFALQRRQLSSGDAQAVGHYADILGRANTAASSSSAQCSSECRPWISAVQGCGSGGGGYTQVGICACRDNVIGKLDPCGTCLGYTSEIGEIQGVCRSELASMSASGTPTSSSSNTNTPVVVGSSPTPGPSSTSGGQKSVLPTLSLTVIVATIGGLLFV